MKDRGQRLREREGLNDYYYFETKTKLLVLKENYFQKKSYEIIFNLVQRERERAERPMEKRHY